MRPTMMDLVSRLRAMANAGTADFTIADCNYWSVDQLQDVLDRHRMEVRDEALTSYSANIAGGSVAWYDYQSSFGNYEQTSNGGSAIFTVRDSLGNVQGTALWSADYDRGLITFAADTGGTAYYLSGRTYDLAGAAAEIWRNKAAAYAMMPDFSTDNHSVKRSHIVQQCNQMADYWQGQSTGNMGKQSIEVARGDLA